MIQMNLISLAQRTGIAPRRLRYAIYHTLMPGVRSVEHGKGAVRHFTHFEAFPASPLRPRCSTRG